VQENGACLESRSPGPSRSYKAPKSFVNTPCPDLLCAFFLLGKKPVHGSLGWDLRSDRAHAFFHSSAEIIASNPPRAPPPPLPPMLVFLFSLLKLFNLCLFPISEKISACRIRASSVNRQISPGTPRSGSGTAAAAASNHFRKTAVVLFGQIRKKPFSVHF